MRQLNIADVQQISGGDYQLTITAHVEDNVAWAVTGLFSAIVTGQIADTTAFMDALNNAIGSGANFNGVRLETIQFSNFN